LEFGVGSAANLIRRLSIVSRSGDVIERIASSGELSSIKMHYLHDQHWLDTVGAAAGHGFAVPASGEMRCSIPLSLLSGLFEYQYLLPSALMSGLRVEVEFESAKIAVMSSSDATFTVDDIFLNLDSYQLTDMALQSLNAAASNAGMEVIISTYFNTQATRKESSLNVESRKAVSRALTCIYHERNATRLTTQSSDSFLGDTINGNYGCVEAQFRLGSNYLPQASIRDTTPVKNAVNIFTHNARTFSTVSAGHGVKLAQHLSGQHILSASLERTSSHGLSGAPISNSRVLALNASITSPANAVYNASFFLQHLVLIRVFLNNASIEV
jgi:hypothetical protein